MRRLTFITAALMVISILVGVQVESANHSRSAPSEATAKPSGAALVVGSQTPPASSEPVEARGNSEADGGDGGAPRNLGYPELSATPTPTETVTPVEEAEVAPQILRTPQPTATQALEAQMDVQRSPNAPGAGSSPAEGSNESQVRAAVESLWPASEWERAMRISKCESGYDPTAEEPGGNHFGTFQLDPSLHGTVPGDIYGQAEQAYGLWVQTGDWSAWSCQ